MHEFHATYAKCTQNLWKEGKALQLEVYRDTYVVQIRFNCYTLIINRRNNFDPC